MLSGLQASSCDQNLNYLPLCFYHYYYYYQDVQGQLMWYIPRVRASIQRQLRPGLDLNLLVPMPGWVQPALDQAVPVGTDWNPVDPAVTAQLMGLPQARPAVASSRQ